METRTEEKGKRDPEVTALCNLEYYEANITKGQTNLITLNDACGVQKRNYDMARFMIDMDNKYLQELQK